MNINNTREVFEQAGIAILGVSVIWRVVIIEVSGILAEVFKQRATVRRERERVERSERRKA